MLTINTDQQYKRYNKDVKMANKAFEFIKKTNQVLIFIGAIVVIFAVVKTSILPQKNSVYQPSQVSIAKADKEGKDTFKPVYKQHYLGLINDVHLFEVASEVIKTSSSDKTETLALYSLAPFDLSSNAVNLLFVRENQTNLRFLERDGLIIRFEPSNYFSQIGDTTNLANQSRSSLNRYEYRLSKNIYLIAHNDSNEDGLINVDDDKSLYISNYDGSDKQLIMENVVRFEMSADNLMMIRVNQNNTTSFYLFDILSNTSTILDTKLR